MRIAVLGAGSWGTALARLLYYNGHAVTLWSWKAEQARQMLAQGENREYLPDIILPPDMAITSDLSAARGAELVVFAVPSKGVTDTAANAAPYITPGTLLVNVAKGFIPGTLQRISEVLCSRFPRHTVSVLSGPSHAEEVARGLITAVCVAGTDYDAMRQVQDVFINRSLRVYTNDDLIGVEIGGAVKNIIALAAGILDGMGQGDNAKAALMTRGLAEMSRLGCAMGANPATFAGLAGVGDLFVTCTSLHSRNYRTGREIGRGKPWRQVVAGTNMVVEGIYATECARALAARHGVEMPITEQMYLLLYGDRSPYDAVCELMAREKTKEG